MSAGEDNPPHCERVSCGLPHYFQYRSIVMPKEPKIRVLFVCMGNICRSPTAEAVFRRTVDKAGLNHVIECASAGTHDYHIGEPPDQRAQLAASRRGYDMSNLRGRKVGPKDFESFDYVVAMDASNLKDLTGLCRSPGDRAKLSLLRDFDPDSPKGSSVPDPYYGGPGGFGEVLDICDAGCRHLLALLRRENGW